MKKMFNIVLVLGIISILYQFFVTIFVTRRNANYSVLTDNNSYMVKEDYKRKGETNMYSFLITDHNKNSYVYSYEGDLNKQSRVIKDIVSYDNTNISCIAPVFKNERIENIVCKYNNELVSYSYLKQISNSDIDKFLNQLSNSKYKVNSEFRDINSVKTDYNNISYYNDIDSDLYFTIWNYKNLYIINNNKVVDKDLLEKDSYENTYGTLVDKFYILVNTDLSFNSFYIVNIKDGGKVKIEADDSISNNMYFNGSYNKKLYLTDIDNKHQFVIDPIKEEIKRVDNPKYFDGKKLVDVDILDLTSTKKYFVKQIIPNKLVKKYGEGLVFSNQNYYFEKDGSVYTIIGNNYEYPLKLFSFDSFKEFKVLNGNVYGINKDTVYMYNSKVGLKKVINHRELIYNYKNIFDVYEK